MQPLGGKATTNFKYNYSISIVLTSSKTGTQNQLVVNVIYVNLKDVFQFFSENTFSSHIICCIK